MYLRWISFICGACACMFCIEWICFTVSGTSSIRTMIVSPTIDQAQGRPSEWRRVEDVPKQVLERCEDARDDHLKTFWSRA